METQRRVIICGSRTWTDARAIARLISMLPENTTVVTGGAKGADRIAERLSKQLDVPCEVYNADWNRYGKSAGYRRNEMMAGLPGVTHVFAFRMPGESKGTDHMVEIAEKARIWYRVFGAREDVRIRSPYVGANGAFM